MRESLLFQTLELMTPDELQRLKVQLASPSFNFGKHAKQIQSLFTLFEENIEEKKEETLEKNTLFEALFPGKAYKRGYFENLMSELMALVRSFIAQQDMKKRWGEALEELALARFFRERNLDERSLHALNRCNMILETKDSVPLEELPLLKMWVEQEVYQVESKYNRRRDDLHLSSAIEALNVFYATELMKFAAVLAEQQIAVPDLKNDWQAFINKTRVLFGEKDHFSNPVIFLLDQAISLVSNVQDTDLEQFHSFLAAFRQHEAAIAPTIQRMLATYTRNFLVKKGHNGEPDADRLLLELYQEHLRKEWLYEYGKLQPTVLINIVNLGLKLGDHEWAVPFLEQHNDRVLGENAEVSLAYCLACYYFDTQQSAEGERAYIKLRQSAKPTDPALEKLVRILEIKIAYEDSEPKKYQIIEDKQLNDLLQNFSMTLRRSKHRINKMLLEKDTNFVIVVKKLARFRKSSKSKPQRQSLYNELQVAGFSVAEKSWLLEKSRALLERAW